MLKKLLAVAALSLFSSQSIAAYIPPAGANNAIQYNKNGQAGGFVLGGDCTVNTATGSQTCTKTGGVNFAASATTDTTNASNISSGTLSNSRLNIGTSGATIPLLNAVNTWSAQQAFNAGMTQSMTTTAGAGAIANNFYLAPIISGASSGSFSTINSSIQYNSASDNTGAVNAIKATADLFSTGAANQVAGIRAQARSLGNGGSYTGASLYGGLFEAGTVGTRAFDHAIGIKINAPTNNGNVNFQSGLYVADQTNLGSATITSQDAIHIEGKSGTDTAVNGIGFGNGGSGINASIYSQKTNAITVNAPTGFYTQGHISNGTKFTTSGGGCTVTSTTGGATAGSFTTSTTGTCTTTITMNGATGLTATNGWACSASNITSGVVGAQSGSSTTTAQLKIATTSGDTVNFSCTGF